MNFDLFYTDGMLTTRFAFFIRKNMLKSFLILSIANIRTISLQLSSKMITQFRFLTSLSLMTIQDFLLACTEKKLTLVYILILTRLPKTLIDRIIKSFLDKKKKLRKMRKILLYFVCRFCVTTVKTKLNKLVKRCYPNIDFKVIFRCPRRIMSYFPFKDRLSTLLCSSVVYKFECPDCNARYYEQTSSHLATRCREHLGVNKVGKKIKVISEHLDQCGHNASIENFSSLNRTNNNPDLLISKSLLILRDRPSLNNKFSSVPLVLFLFLISHVCSFHFLLIIYTCFFMSVPIPVPVLVY